MADRGDRGESEDQGVDEMASGVGRTGIVVFIALFLLF
jgi:hypothetical protein